MREVPLGEVLDLLIDHRGKTPKKLGGDFTDSGVKVVSAIHIKNGRINWDERERYVSESMFHRWMPSPTRRGDVLLTSEAPLGEVAQVADDEPLVLSQRLFALRGKSGVLHSTYLRYFLQSDIGRQRLLSMATGSTVSGIRQELLRTVRVPLPSFDEQERIAGALGAFDDLIDANRQVAADLDALTKCTYRAETGALPRVPLSELLRLAYGKALPAKKRVPGPVPVVSSAGITGSHNEALVNGPGVVVGRKGTVGSVTWVRDDFYPIDTAFYAISDLAPEIVFETLTEANLTLLNSDSAVPGLNRDRALAQPVADVRGGPARRLAPLLRAFRHTRDELLAEAAELSSQRDELLPLLMSGRVRVRDLEAVA